MNCGSDCMVLCMFTSVKREFRDVSFTKMKKKKVLYNECISVEVMFESRSYERCLVIFFPLTLKYASLAASVSSGTLRSFQRRKKIFYYS